MPYIFHICFLDMFHVQGGIFPCVWINLWSQEQVRRWRKSEVLSNLAPKLHVLVPKLAFWGDFTTVRYHFSARKLMSTLKPSKNAVWRSKTTFFRRNAFKKGYVFLEDFPGGLPWRGSLHHFSRKVLINFFNYLMSSNLWL